jgi:hypothetical protein
MSNVCRCPKPPGGKIECSDDQLAVCGYQNGEIVSGCYDRPAHVREIEDLPQRNLVLANWVISTITGEYRSDFALIDSSLFAMLRSGQYIDGATREVLTFGLPRDRPLRTS